MKTSILTAVLLSLATPALHAAETPLFRMTSSQDAPAMVFQEIARSEEASVIEAEYTAGSVAAKSQFTMRATCALMKARSKEAFLIEQVAGQPKLFTVRFVRGDDPRALTAAGCDFILSVPVR